MKKFIIVYAILLVGCVQVTPPLGQENQKEFTQEFDRPFKEVYRTTVRQLIDCYAGPGAKVIPELDMTAQRAQIEMSADRGPSSWDRGLRTVIIEGLSDKKTKVTTLGKTPSFVYGTHTMIPKWLAGSTDCT